MFATREDTVNSYQRAARLSEKIDRTFAPNEQVSQNERYGYRADSQQAPVYPHSYEQTVAYPQEEQVTDFEPEQIEDQPVPPVEEKPKRRHPKFVDRFIKRNN